MKANFVQLGTRLTTIRVISMEMKSSKRIHRELNLLQYNGYEMIEKHIQRHEDLVDQSTENCSDEFMKNTLLESIKRNKSVHKFQSFITGSNIQDDFYLFKNEEKVSGHNLSSGRCN